MESANAKPRDVWFRWSVALPAVVLALAVALQATNPFRETPRPRPPHLARSIPARAEGWVGRDVPLGANEFLTGEVQKILNYDDVLNREYTNGVQSFGVYVAYWGAGKMPTRFVAIHTPDRCWTGNGWRCLEMKFRQPEDFAGTPFKPAEWRLFEPPSGEKPVYVLFWHLVEGRLYDYGKRFNDVPDPFLWWKDAVQQALLGSREQYFFRLTSSEPIENFRGDPGFDEVVRSLARLGLAQDRTETINHS
jgi:hypothetical protein